RFPEVVAHDSSLDRIHHSRSGGLYFLLGLRPGVDRSAPADQPSLMQYCQVTGIPEQLTADNTVPSARSDK
ncbi:hypothetical protein, partial [Nocardia cyriacigeorgica]|uniref:hypothetical protein n=1 Tax=Nocardia cyriacigeorgica TaxID=135487 RepID=UPI00245678BC